MTNAPLTAIGHYLDLESLNHHALATAAGTAEEQVMASLAAKSRDHARTPVQWDASPHAGFTTGTPWSAVNPNHVEINAEAARHDPTSVFAHFQRLIRLRHDSEVVREGRFDLLLADHEQIWAFTRTLGKQSLLVLANCSSGTVAIPDGLVPDASTTRVVLGTHPRIEASVLQPWESLVLQVNSPA